jgi:hypothetical protein
VPALGGWLVTSHELPQDVRSRRDDFTVWAQPNLARVAFDPANGLSDEALEGRLDPAPSPSRAPSGPAAATERPS